MGQFYLQNNFWTIFIKQRNFWTIIIKNNFSNSIKNNFFWIF